MAQKVDPHVFSPEALADESLFDDEEPMTRPGVSQSHVPPPRPAKGHAPRPRIRAAKDPDAEALELVAKMTEKLAVARSLARIASSVVRSYADQKMAEIVETDAANAMAHVDRVRRVAMAAKEAATHAASMAAARAAARTQDFVQDATDLAASLDHEDAHDDAC